MTLMFELSPAWTRIALSLPTCLWEEYLLLGNSCLEARATSTPITSAALEVIGEVAAESKAEELTAKIKRRIEKARGFLS